MQRGLNVSDSTGDPREIAPQEVGSHAACRPTWLCWGPVELTHWIGPGSGLPGTVCRSIVSTRAVWETDAASKSPRVCHASPSRRKLAQRCPGCRRCVSFRLLWASFGQLGLARAVARDTKGERGQGDGRGLAGASPATCLFDRRPRRRETIGGSGPGDDKRVYGRSRARWRAGSSHTLRRSRERMDRAGPRMRRSRASRRRSH